MNTSDLITVDPEILGGTPVFKSTRVPIKTLFDYLERDYTLEEFLGCFPKASVDHQFFRSGAVSLMRNRRDEPIERGAS